MRNILISLFVIFSQLAFGGTSFDMTSPIPVVKNLKEGLADLGDVKFWYQDTGGQGEAIVFFHPGSGSFEFYPFQQIGLAEKGYRVITYSRRGNYKSEIGSQPEQSFAPDDFIHLLDFF